MSDNSCRPQCLDESTLRERKTTWGNFCGAAARMGSTGSFKHLRCANIDSIYNRRTWCTSDLADCRAQTSPAWSRLGQLCYCPRSSWARSFQPLQEDRRVAQALSWVLCGSDLDCGRRLRQLKRWQPSDVRQTTDRTLDPEAAVWSWRIISRISSPVWTCVHLVPRSSPARLDGSPQRLDLGTHDTNAYIGIEHGSEPK